MRSWGFEIAFTCGPEGWTFTVGTEPATVLGPFPTEADARAAEHGLLQRWRERARSLGGYVWRATSHSWGACLPDEVPVRGRPLRSAACTRAA